MDIKPANVLLDRNLGLAVCDYGISIQLPSESPTQDGDGLYLAPEVLTKEYPVT
jgi:serine/threonine protein kinase